MKPILSCSDVDFTYQNSPAPALRDVALTVQPGECVLLCGRSGCGKTTFSRLLNGLAPVFYPGALAGRCTAAGLAAGEAAIEDYVPQVGSVFQNPKTQYFNVDTTAELAFPCENSGLPPETIRARVAETARKFHIEPLMGRSVLKLSGGEKQQVAFATACMLGPKLLVLDEPTSNLDAAAITRMHDMVATMKQCGVTVVLAEHRLAWITDLVDRYFYFADGALKAQWTAAEFAALPPEGLTEYGLRGRTLGVIGFGSIGRRVGELGHAFGMSVLANCRTPRNPPSYSPFAFASTDQIFQQADVISLHCPLTDATRAIINAKALARMKPGAILINTARGPLLDEAAVAEALHSGKLGGLGVDVLAKEPPAADNPLLHTPNTLITPHMAWATARSRQNIINLTAENILRWQQGTLVNVVNGVKE